MKVSNEDQTENGVLPFYDEDVKGAESSLFDQEVATINTSQSGEGFEDEEMEDGELESDSSSYGVLSSYMLADVVEALIGVYFVEVCSREYSYALNIKFKDTGLLVEAITHASRPSSGVSCYQTLRFVGDAVLDHLISRHLFFTYTDLPPGRLRDKNFAQVAVKHKPHMHLRHGSGALEKQIRDLVREVQVESLKPGFYSFGLGHCKAPKVLEDIVESIAGAIFLDSICGTATVWRVRINVCLIGIALNPQKKAQKLTARHALIVLKDKETAKEKRKREENGKKNRSQIKGGPAHAKRFTLAVCFNTSDKEWTDECVGEPMPSVKEDMDAAAQLLLELLKRWYT
ncbi:Ribonuclease III domain [Dillenia turbinata]|uniref:Ribonuclease III domain n=1 Tax=Dillenia turbinata TaxID=194707 RepID=A0AAN8VM31_9MAGN